MVPLPEHPEDHHSKYREEHQEKQGEHQVHHEKHDFHSLLFHVKHLNHSCAIISSTELRSREATQAVSIIRST